MDTYPTFLAVMWCAGLCLSQGNHSFIRNRKGDAHTFCASNRTHPTVSGTEERFIRGFFLDLCVCMIVPKPLEWMCLLQEPLLFSESFPWDLGPRLQAVSLRCMTSAVARMGLVVFAFPVCREGSEWGFLHRGRSKSEKSFLGLLPNRNCCGFQATRRERRETTLLLFSNWLHCTILRYCVLYLHSVLLCTSIALVSDSLDEYFAQ